MLPLVRYGNDTSTAIKADSIDYIVVMKIYEFHNKMQFTKEIEDDHCLQFLDVKLIRQRPALQTTVHRKLTNSDIYLH